MNKNKRTTRPRKATSIRDDEKLKSAEIAYIQDQDFNDLSKSLAKYLSSLHRCFERHLK